MPSVTWVGRASSPVRIMGHSRVAKADTVLCSLHITQPRPKHQRHDKYMWATRGAPDAIDWYGGSTL